MLIEFQLPNIGEGVDSADIAEILIAEGATLAANQIVMELETDKAVVELPSPHGGVIQKMLVEEGDTVAIGQTLFTIEAADAAVGHSPGRSAPAVEESPGPAEEEPGQTEVDTGGEAPTAASASASTGPVEFLLPSLGEGVDAAEVAELHVAAGDRVAAEQIVMELETDKAVVELPCPHAGTVATLHVAPGDTIQVGQPLMTINGVASAAPHVNEDATASPSGVSAATDTPDVEPPPSTLTATESNGESRRPVSTARVPEIVTGDEHGLPPVPAAPSTRRLARQLGVNLRQVNGSGPGGRITQEDVQEYVKGLLNSGLPAVSSGGGLAIPAAGSIAPPPLPDFSKYGLIDREKMSKLARTAAENLTVSWNVIPHVTQHDRADVTELEAARKKFTKGAGADGPKVTMTAIVMKALATALQQNPKFNSSLDPETNELVYKRYYNIGCAVDTPSGLLVPVVKDVDKKSIRDVAGEIAELAGLARDRKLPIDAMQGATCTVTNLGGIGGVAFTPIVNYPEVCILGLARGQQELRLDEGELTQRLMLPLCLSYDHRVINGADAARFLVSLCNMLSDPFQLLSAI